MKGVYRTPGPQTANLKRKPETLWALPTDVLSAVPPQYQYKKNYEKSKGHYHTIPDNLEQLHLKEATELQSIVSPSRGRPTASVCSPAVSITSTRSTLGMRLLIDFI